MKNFIEEDPFMCPECAILGYCIIARNNSIEAAEKERIREEENTSIPEELIEVDNEVLEEELVEQD